jgi:hypothetical protein
MVCIIIKWDECWKKWSSDQSTISPQMQVKNLIFVIKNMIFNFGNEINCSLYISITNKY